MLPLGWHTDIVVLERSGADVVRRADHLLVRSPRNPAYHWGNFVLVTDPAAVGEAEHWLGVFEAAFPGAGHRAIGLVADPEEPEAWTRCGLELEHEDVLVAARLADTPIPRGYTVRALREDDWEQDAGLGIAEHPGADEFERRSTQAKRRLCADGSAAYFGAFWGPELAAGLGIVDCGAGVARFQAVLTAAPHRRRGLASHLLGVAAHWGVRRGCDRLVILADADGPASRLYRGLGFGPELRTSQAYRGPRR